jgi:hypothetical protein
MTYLMDKGFGSHLVLKDIKGNLKWVIEMVKELIIMLMEMFSKEIGQIIKSMDMEFLIVQELIIKVSGKMDFHMEKVSINLMILQNIKANSKMENLKGEVNLQTKFFAMKDCFKMVCFKDKE